MKKQIKIIIFIIVLSLSNNVFAVNENKIQCTGQNVCFADDLVNDLIKETVKAVGKQILEKYCNDNNRQYNHSNTYNNTNNQAQKKTQPNIQAQSQVQQKTQTKVNSVNTAKTDNTSTDSSNFDGDMIILE